MERKTEALAEPRPLGVSHRNCQSFLLKALCVLLEEKASSVLVPHKTGNRGDRNTLLDEYVPKGCSQRVEVDDMTIRVLVGKPAMTRSLLTCFLIRRAKLLQFFCGGLVQSSATATRNVVNPKGNL